MVLPGSAVSSDQRRCPVEEGSVIEGQALGTDRLVLDPHVLLAREHVAEVQALHEEGDEGMKDSGQRSVQEYQAGDEATVDLLVDRAEQVDDERQGATAVVEACTAGRQDDSQYPVCATCWLEAWGFPLLDSGRSQLQQRHP